MKQNLSFNVTKAKKLMEGYNEVRKISKDEKVAINRAKMTKFGIRVADLTVVFVKD